MIRVVAPYGADGSSTRVRILDWLAHVRLDGDTHFYADFPDNRVDRLLRHPRQVARAEYDLRRLDVRGDTVLMSREASPFGRGKTEERILGTAAHSVFDFDDAIYVDSGGPRSWFRPEEKTRRSVAAAHVVVAGNEYLADWAEKHHRDVRVIPSCVEPDDYVPRTSWDLPEGEPVIVWLGSPSTEVFLEPIAPALLQVAQKHGARIRLISGPSHNPALSSLDPVLERVPWSLSGYAHDLAGADVAIAPLTDTAFARGKCAYKLLQYAATALPMIGSPVGANALALERFDGVAATSPAEWADGLDELLTESSTRREQRGRAGLGRVREHYAFEAWRDVWCAAMGLAVGTP
ncbi:hypothetical protein N798_05055 [Knoellia flava TL1]|uniref:Glycosyl transferase n=2 Tax=Knoellia flava TaxID=913969 RepID=A0A8H9FVF6_9MICO|nr:glycosyltransferase [Knoellia flava]KGN34012.1 hypothetical protein N798_05055 [Knoellia flava TL1]GGB83659.1 glycosyl transferase [Knoellia flava]